MSCAYSQRSLGICSSPCFFATFRRFGYACRWSDRVVSVFLRSRDELPRCLATRRMSSAGKAASGPRYCVPSGTVRRRWATGLASQRCEYRCIHEQFELAQQAMIVSDSIQLLHCNALVAWVIVDARLLGNFPWLTFHRIEANSNIIQPRFTIMCFHSDGWFQVSPLEAALFNILFWSYGNGCGDVDSAAFVLPCWKCSSISCPLLAKRLADLWTSSCNIYKVATTTMSSSLGCLLRSECICVFSRSLV